MFCQLHVQHVSLIKFIIGCIIVSSIVNVGSSTINYLSIKILVHKEFWVINPMWHTHFALSVMSMFVLTRWLHLLGWLQENFSLHLSCPLTYDNEKRIWLSQDWQWKVFGHHRIGNQKFLITNGLTKSFQSLIQRWPKHVGH